MKGLDEFLVPYVISQIAAIAILITAIYSTRRARKLLSVLFGWASCTNMYLGITDADSYLGNAAFALPLYRDFINGWFSHYNQMIIPAIAFGQLLIAIGMVLEGWWVKWACIGAIIFLMSIAPLMVASAFPFSLIVSAAVVIILKKDTRQKLWKKKQPSTQN